MAMPRSISPLLVKNNMQYTNINIRIRSSKSPENESKRFLSFNIAIT